MIDKKTIELLQIAVVILFFIGTGLLIWVREKIFK